MKILFDVRIIVLALVLLVNGVAQAGDAQQENPLFVEARNLWQQISASSLDNDTKAPYGKRFGDLAVEQRSLWSLAGQVDSGACTDQCLDNYNDRVLTWQSNLQSFNSDARTALESPGLPEAGVWKPFGEFTHGNLGICRQTWACVPKGEVMHDPGMKIISPPMQTLTGYCSIKDNPEDCGACSATWTPPADHCLWHLESR
jgi:hypothetical protein